MVFKKLKPSVMDGFRSSENPERRFGLNICFAKRQFEKASNKEKKKNDNLPLKIAVSFGAERGI